MKKLRSTFAVSLVFVMLVALLAANTVFAAGNERVATADIPAWKFAGGWEITSDYVAEGVRATVPGVDTVGSANAWSYKAKIPNEDTLTPVFSIADGQKVTVELSVKFYNADGSLVSKSQNSDALDIYVMDAATNQQVGLLRIWAGSGSPTNGDHSCEVFGSDWTNRGAGYWIKGDATAESKFTIQIDRENFISSYAGGQDGMVSLANEELRNDRRAVLENVDAIRLEIGGDNGFTASTEVVVRSINGQSLANVDGQITDTVAPVFRPADVLTALNAGEAYTIPTEAYDLLGDVTYSLKIGETVVEGKTFTPDQPGEMTVTLVAADAAGNTSEINYTFQVVSSIAAPEIQSVPALQDMSVAYFETLMLDGITYADETGTASVQLKIMQGEQILAVLPVREDGKFAYFITSDFISGEYTFVYEVTNSAGTAASEPQTVTLTAEAVDRVEFVQGLNGNMLAQYAPSGLLLRSIQDWRDFFLGTFDISEGMDIKFIVNPNVTNGAKNDAASVDFIFVNADDENFKVMYRVWIDHSGPDRATNVYISTNGGQNFTDITDTGWISRNVDDIAGQYHMAFDPEETFVGERTGGMTRVDRAYEQLVAFFEACPSMRFHVGLAMGNLSGADGNYEMIVTELNGQSFVGDSITWEDAYLSIKTGIPEKVLNGTTLPIQAYAKDIRGQISLLLRVTAPDGTTADLEFNGNTLEYTFDQLGDYSLTVLTIGLNGNEVQKTFQVSCRSSVSPIDITLDGSYQESYAQNSTMTILSAAYSDNVVNKTVTITTPAGKNVTVEIGQEYKFALPGVYVITYTAQDDAQPVANEHSISMTINVPDTQKPEVTVTVADSAVVGDPIKPVIVVKDDSECDLTVTLVKPDGSTVKLDASSDYAFTGDTAGEYTLKVTVEDLYGNKETVTKTLTVTQAQGGDAAQTPSGGMPVGLIVAVVAVIVIGTVVVIVLLNKKKK